MSCGGQPLHVLEKVPLGRLGADVQQNMLENPAAPLPILKSLAKTLG
jgi:hypothetical protein